MSSLSAAEPPERPAARRAAPVRTSGGAADGLGDLRARRGWNAELRRPPDPPRSARSTRPCWAMRISDTASWMWRWIVRRSGRAPGRRLDARPVRAATPWPRPRPPPAARARQRLVDVVACRMSTIGRSSSSPSGLKTITSSMRLMNSGLNVRRSSPRISSSSRWKLCLASPSPKPMRPPRSTSLRADVGGHQDQGVLEVDLVAVGVGEQAVLQDLEEQVGDVGVRLLDLVEQDQRVGLAPDALGELPALLVADVARRRADQLGDRVLLHVLATCRSAPAPAGCRTGTRRAGAPPRSCRRPRGRGR